MFGSLLEMSSQTIIFIVLLCLGGYALLSFTGLYKHYVGDPMGATSDPITSYPYQPNDILQPLPTFDKQERPDIIRLQSDRDMFNSDSVERIQHVESCVAHAKNVCRRPRLITRNDCYQTQAVELDNPLSRSNQILGTDMSYRQSTNNVSPLMKCDCASRDSELCADEDVVDEACFEKQFESCMV